MCFLLFYQARLKLSLKGKEKIHILTTSGFQLSLKNDVLSPCVKLKFESSFYCNYCSLATIKISREK